MAKQGMARPESPHTQNEMPPVPEIQGKAKNDKKATRPMISGIVSPDQKASHTERPLSSAYKPLDNDLARDNMENDLPDADLQDL